VRRLLLVAVSVSVLAAGCSNSSTHTIDQHQWAKDLAGIGQTVQNWPQYEAAAKSMCDSSDLPLLVATGLDQGQSLDVLRIDFQNACPDKIDDLEKAITNERGAVSDVQAACDLPPRQRTQAQKDLAVAMCC
jgi:hypothetical protein